MPVKLAIVETHPVQYHAPVYRRLAADFDIDVHVVYGSDFSIAGYRDKEFGSSFSWDTDLLGGVSNHFLSSTAKGGAGSYDAVEARGLFEMLESIKPDAVLSLGYSHRFDRAGLAWTKRSASPLLFRGETSDDAHRRSWLKGLLRHWVLRRLYQRCSALLYVGSRSQAHYTRLGVPSTKLFFSPYCVDESTFQCSDRSLRKTTRERLGIGDDELVILFSGKLSRRKGVDLLPKALRKLALKARLLFVGDGALRESLKQECEIDPTVPVTFVGFQNQSNLSAFYHAADMLVLPSREKETWGLVVNEALMHGLPCVVSDAVGSQPDLVIPGCTGERCACDSVDALAEAVSKTASMAKRDDVAHVCRATVRKYSVASAARGIAEAIERMVPA